MVKVFLFHYKNGQKGVTYICLNINLNVVHIIEKVYITINRTLIVRFNDVPSQNVVYQSLIMSNFDQL